MAFLQVNFFSNVLGMCMNMNVVLPQQTRSQIGMEGKAAETYPTVYLLHGMSDDHTVWHARTSIERYATEMGVAVVMPTTHLGWYTDTAYGMKYWTFISKELPEICRDFFPKMSKKPEETLAAGLSMGGYGAWKLALGASETFGAGASLSGGYLHLGDFDQAELSEERRLYWQGIFGDLSKLKGSNNDIMHLAETLKESGKSLPKLFAWCGTEDWLYKQNLQAWKQVKELGYDCTTSESSGDHQWRYWDEQIQNVLKWWKDKCLDKTEK